MKGVNILTGELVETSFYTQYIQPLPDREVHDASVTQTVQAYQDTASQVEEFMAAGVRLNQERMARFETDLVGQTVDLEQLEVGITRGADVVDVQRAGSAAEGRLRSQMDSQAAAAATKAAADSKAADDARIEAAVQARLKELGK